jgi:hypothetical protein
MGRIYKKRTNREPNDPENIRAAIDAVGNPIKRSFVSVARDFKIKTTTLQRHYQKAIARGLADYVPLPESHHRQVFTKQQEDLLEEFFIVCAGLHHGLTHNESQLKPSQNWQHHHLFTLLRTHQRTRRNRQELSELQEKK